MGNINVIVKDKTPSVTIKVKFGRKGDQGIPGPQGESDHLLLDNIGTLTHLELESAISNRVLKTGDVMSGTLTAPNYISNNQATQNNHVVRLDQMNSAIMGMSWQVPVLDEIDFSTSEPTGRSVGDRYINTTTGNSNETAQSVTANNIYEWDGSVWAEFVPQEGWTVWIEDLDTNYTFNGTNWVEFGSTVSHNNTMGLQGGIAGEYYHLTQNQHDNLALVNQENTFVGNQIIEGKIDLLDNKIKWGNEDKSIRVYANVMTLSTFSDFKFVNWNGAAYSQKAILTQDGNVGINILNPTEKLHVIGTIAGDYFKVLNGDNTIYGLNALSNVTTGYDSIAIGKDALLSLTEKWDNVAIGRQSMTTLVDGYKNVAVGNYTLKLAENSVGNVAIGHYSLNKTTSNYNVSVGYYTLADNSTGHNLVAIGKTALRKNTSGIQNIAIGVESMYYNLDGSYNTAIGYRSSYLNESGTMNVSNGFNALYSNIDGNYNTAIGGYSGRKITNSNNVTIGYRAMWNADDVSYNVSIGVYSLAENISGIRNTVIGGLAGNNATGSLNVFLGYQSGYNETESNRLHIANTSTKTLIRGEFDNDLVEINSNLIVRNTDDNQFKIGLVGSIMNVGTTTYTAMSIRANNNQAIYINQGASVQFTRTIEVAAHGHGVKLTSEDGTQSKIIIITNSGTIDVIDA